MKKIAIVVQRIGKELVGGSEGYAFGMAKLLSELSFDVEILTTTAIDHITWENYYNEGIEDITKRFRIRRFKVDFKKSPYWHDINRIIFRGLPLDLFFKLGDKEKDEYINIIRKTPVGLQEEWMKFQGPYSSNLLEYIKAKQDNYDLFIFMTYLYPTTYIGIDMIMNRNKVFIVPTFHDEPAAYFSIMRKYLNLKFMFLTNAEKKLANKIFQYPLCSEIIGFGLKDKFADINPYTSEDYFLYAGRIDEGKGVRELFEFFIRFSKRYNNTKLYTIGDGPLKDFSHECIKYLGFVNEEQKLSLMKGAIGFVHPSPYESLGIVLIESFMMGTPAVINRKSEVLYDHIINSNGGFAYNSYEDFETYMTDLIKNRDLRDKYGKNARIYYLKNYSLTSFKDKCVQTLNNNQTEP